MQEQNVSLCNSQLESFKMHAAFKTEIPTTTEYINQYFNMKIFFMVNRTALLRLCDSTR